MGEDCCFLSEKAQFYRRKNLELQAELNILHPLNAWQPTTEMWASVPEWCVWCVGNGRGRLEFYECEPYMSSRSWTVDALTFSRYEYSNHELPLGIDWRLAKWRRPE